MEKYHMHNKQARQGNERRTSNASINKKGKVWKSSWSTWKTMKTLLIQN
jgi:hypothetical protein